MSAEKIIKKNKSKKIKPKDIIIEEKSPKNVTLKASSSSNTKKRCKNGTKKYKPLGIGCYTKKEIENHPRITPFTPNIVNHLESKISKSSNRISPTSPNFKFS